jgi:hypothetical protein
MILELMGHLASFYRNRTQGTGVFSNQQTGNSEEAMNTRETDNG